MKIGIHALWVAVLVFYSATALAEKPKGALYLDGGNSQIGLVLAHGRGKHPRWKVVEPVRKGVHEKLGYHTLSLQMPNAKKNYIEYAADFPKAFAMIAEGIRFLEQGRGVTQVFLFGHSMGSRMVSAFVSENPGRSLSGIVVAGCRNNGGYPLSCAENLGGVGVPVLDIWGGRSRKDVAAARERKHRVSETYMQSEIKGAGHRFEGYDTEIVWAVVNWLKAQ